ncbi:MAG TPA: 2'-5' RNA ligase family protein [Syntrophobacteria bacterium]|nr:2'-5' RNA ligase family protein [Syntrophobacteria bacterium]
MTRKTHKTALVIIPPAAAWPPIQAVRRLYDRQYRRWMPHVTLIYPFRPLAEFSGLCETLASAYSRLAPFAMTLESFRFFEHSPRSCTVWLAPDPPEPLIQLQTELWRLVPDCSEVRGFRGGFAPHLSVGQAPGRKAALAWAQEWQELWRPLRFTVSEISLIARGDPPDDVFRVQDVLSLGR